MKIAIIAGGNGDVGLATARIFLKHKYKVVIMDKVISPNKEANIYYCCCDITNVEEVRKSLKEIVIKFKKLDVLVNCVGVQEVCDWNQLTLKSWKKIIKNNLTGTFILLHEISKYLAKNAAIVNVSSIHAKNPRIDKFSYDAAKAGIEILSKEVALTLKEKKIRVNIVEPGVIDTKMNRGVNLASEQIIDYIPLRRVGTPIEVAKVIYFLCSSAASYVNGATVSVDGGRQLIK